MKLKSILISTITSIYISGCASNMPPETYRMLAELNGSINRCYNEKMLSLEVFNKSKNALSATAKSWNYDSDRLLNMSDAVYKERNASIAFCQIVETEAYNLISQVYQQKAQEQTSLNSLSLALQDISSNMQKFNNNFQYTPINAPQLNWQPIPNSFTQEKNGTQNYLINTENGIKRVTCQGLNTNSVYCF